MGEATEGMLGAFRKGGGMLEAGRTWYADASCKKEKSFCRAGGDVGLAMGLVKTSWRRGDSGAGERAARVGERSGAADAFWDERAASGLQDWSVN